MPKALSQRQLACIQSLWARRMRTAAIAGGEEARELRHAYIREVTSGRAAATNELSFADAMRVIRSLIDDQAGRRTIADRERAQAAGTHGRRGSSSRQIAIASPEQVNLLIGHADRLGWTRERLDAFIARQLGSGRRVRTVGDCNKVLWGLKSMLRRRAKDGDSGAPINPSPSPSPSTA